MVGLLFLNDMCSIMLRFQTFTYGLSTVIGTGLYNSPIARDIGQVYVDNTTSGCDQQPEAI